ncbi:hypothetical protein [Deinococcus maricopensis]|uniref:Uncharacterized protein n=1 Tax=Deinococcus maricopensis (strain DSM 21211 / LMG 22137 / NRRL B-23946 / LB-34) TaxID=709986 RepID=E8U9M4_DEIML|nr:hypothetical protein [Deinococcus maricopensis]ADV67763.1 hypothetical protein Deima_2121 [Deinococcus maricopensis DSM 21211]
MTDAAIRKGQRLLALWRAAQGGERDKARNVLMHLLTQAGLTLHDLDATLPALTDPALTGDVRPADALLLALNGTPEEVDAAILALVDEPDLTPAERARVLERLNVARLAETRAEGWVYGHPDAEITPDLLVRAAQTLGDAEVAGAPARTLADAVRDLSLLHAARLARPERALRVDSELTGAFLASVCAALSGVPASLHSPDAAVGAWRVNAYLSANELARVRAVQASEGDALRRELLRAARAFGRATGEALRD